MSRPHWSYWIVASLGLLWSLGGCMNYIVQRNPDAVAQMPDLYRLIIQTRPDWATWAFAVAVFGGAVGCILLLLRRRIAVQVLILSLMGTIVVVLDTVTRVGMAPSVLLSVMVAGALVWYASIAARKGWLG